uniref:Uncharacterized protein n=1 Tax=Knipowitschia caucasica TaxID=637954 RepID=A0AAV2MR67_KNICA
MCMRVNVLVVFCWLGDRYWGVEEKRGIDWGGVGGLKVRGWGGWGGRRGYVVAERDMGRGWEDLGLVLFGFRGDKVRGRMEDMGYLLRDREGGCGGGKGVCWEVLGDNIVEVFGGGG